MGVNQNISGLGRDGRVLAIAPQGPYTQASGLANALCWRLPDYLQLSGMAKLANGDSYEDARCCKTILASSV